MVNLNYYDWKITMNEYLRICLYCAQNMNDPTEAQIKVFGIPRCCNDEEMVRIKTSNIHSIIKSLDKLKIIFEKELLRGTGCEQFLDQV